MALTQEDYQCIHDIQELVEQGAIRTLALDFDETITIQGYQRGMSMDVYVGPDDVVLQNMFRPQFVRALLYAVYNAGGRICIVSFQDDLVGNAELGIITGRRLVERHIDALLGSDRPYDMLQYDQDYMLWNPSIRCGINITDSNKNNHLRAVAMWSGRRDSHGNSPNASGRQDPKTIVFIDDSVRNVHDANAAGVARSYVAVEGIDRRLCQSIVQDIRAERHHQSQTIPSQSSLSVMPSAILFEHVQPLQQHHHQQQQHFQRLPAVDSAFIYAAGSGGVINTAHRFSFGQGNGQD